MPLARLWGLPLNIRHGNGAFVVVRARESLVHGEGKQLMFLIRLKENVRDIMRNPAVVLNNLTKQSMKTGYQFEKLYRVLFNEEMFYVAYQQLYAREGNMTAGTDGQTIDEMSLQRIEKLIGSLRDESYQPQPARRVYIPKKDGKKRPLGIPSFNDKLVQQTVKMILESIYEAAFEPTSHGFRPHRSCHTALVQVNRNYSGVKWFIEGDIKGFFDNISHDVLIEILRERIVDERFIRLIRKFLNAGYIEDWTFHKTYSGTPQGGIISPIMANIYLDKLDKYMKEYTEKFDKGARRADNAEYHRLSRKIAKLNYKLEKVEDTEKVLRRARVKEILKERSQLSAGNQMDDAFRRIKYIRYADDFIIGVIGSKEECQLIKKDISNFLKEKLSLELSDEKTLITHAGDRAKFLGYEIFVRKSTSDTKRNVLGHLSRCYNGRVVLYVPSETMRKKLEDYEVIRYTRHNNVEKWKPQSRIKLVNNDDLEILETYNAEIRGFYNYFSIASNAASIHDFSHIMQYSMYKTFAKKYSTTVRKIIAKYRINKDFAVRYENKKGEQKTRVFYNGGFKKKLVANVSLSDQMPSSIYNTSSTSLIDRLKAAKCELCGDEGTMEMHHVRKVKDLKGKAPWVAHMIARRRKTIAVCQPCHKKIHNGG
jgi:group II intron reverse transcriptase/maturase